MTDVRLPEESKQHCSDYRLERITRSAFRLGCGLVGTLGLLYFFQSRMGQAMRPENYDSSYIIYDLTLPQAISFGLFVAGAGGYFILRKNAGLKG